MEAKELRIGNITDKGEIKSFWEHGIHVGKGKCYKFSEVEPVPLTEEWLLKLGFTVNVNKDSGFGYAIKGGFKLCVDNGEYYFELRGSVIEIKHIHQLQNLYFAITEKELKMIGQKKLRRLE